MKPEFFSTPKAYYSSGALDSLLFELSQHPEEVLKLKSATQYAQYHIQDAYLRLRSDKRVSMSDLILADFSMHLFASNGEIQKTAKSIVDLAAETGSLAQLRKYEDWEIGHYEWKVKGLPYFRSLKLYWPDGTAPN